jgi:hypothetical protein
MSSLKDLIKHLTNGRLEDTSAAPITFNIDTAPAVNLNKHDQPALRHNSWVSSLPIGTFLLYTDGSKLDNGQVGCGATTCEITTNGPRQLQHHQYNLGSVRHHDGLCLSRDRQHTGGEFGAGARAIQEGIQTVLCGGALFFSEETIVVSLGLGYFSVILIFIYS